MSDRVTNSVAGDDERAARRLMGSRSHKSSKANSPTRLILTPQLRVVDNNVLRLMPEYKVPPSDRLETSKDANLAQGNAALSADTSPISPSAQAAHEKADADVLVLTSPINTPSRVKATDVGALKAKITALETAIAKTSDQWEPDGVSSDPYAGTQALAMSWPEDELDSTGAPIETVVHQALTETVQTAVADQALDEQALRSMVSDIVKSELQGELGDRITRNVRKLVRREIHRALTAKSFS